MKYQLSNTLKHDCFEKLPTSCDSAQKLNALDSSVYSQTEDDAGTVISSRSSVKRDIEEEIVKELEGVERVSRVTKLVQSVKI